jgi:hypothetical protein
MKQTSSNTGEVKWSVEVGRRALDPRVSGTEVQKRLGLKIEKLEVQVVPRVADFWIEHRTGAWIAAYRIVAANGRPWIGEIRVFPAGDFSERPKGEWVEGTLAGVQAPVPIGGLTGKVLADLQPQRWRRAAAHVIRSLYGTPAGARMPVMKLFAPYAPKRVHSARGRTPLSDEFYTEIARKYTEALGAGHRPVQTLMKLYKAPENRVRGWIHRARQRGFLERPVLQGKASGTLVGQRRDVASRPTKRRGKKS